MFIETFQLSKSYGAFRALQDCSLQIEEGEVYGLLGPNGAGKTTFLRLLLGFLRPTSGSASIAGLDCHRQSLQVRRKTAYLPGDARMFSTMRGRQALKFFAEIRGEKDVSRFLQLAERLELDLARKVGSMSTGMRQKLALAAMLGARTPLLILDEPTANLDPTVRGEVLKLVTEAQDQGRTVIFSSHVLSEVEEICGRVAFLRRGHLVHEQSVAELRRRHLIRARVRGDLPPPPENEELEIRLTGENLELETPGELAPLLGWLATLPLEEIQIEPIGLRAVYDRCHGESE